MNTFTLYGMKDGYPQWIDYRPLAAGKVLVSVREQSEPKYGCRPDGTKMTMSMDMMTPKARQHYADKLAKGFKRVF